MVSIRGTTITVTKGDTLEAIVELLLEDGTPYQPQEGDEIRFALKQRYEDRVPLLLKPIPNDTLRLRLEAEDTKRLRAGWVPYVYDMQITFADGSVDTFIDRAKFIVTDEVE
jgi:hypothetical protein